VSKTLENGSFQDAVGTVVNGGTIEFVLSHDAMIIAGGQVAPTRVSATLDSSGDMPSAFTILANDELTPTGTFYLTTVFDSNGARVFGPERWVFSGASPIDLDTMTPTIVDPAFADPILSNPVAAQAVADFNLAVPILNNVRVVDGTKFTTIQAAIDDLPTSTTSETALGAGGGIVYAPPGIYSESITLRSNVQVIGAGESTVIRATGAGVNIVTTVVDSVRGGLSNCTLDGNSLASVIGLDVHSHQQGSFNNLRLVRGGTTSIAIRLRATEATGTIDNVTHNQFRDIEIFTFTVGIELDGASSNAVVTLNTFDSVLLDVPGDPYAIDFVKNADTNRFDNIRIGITGGFDGIAFNSATPTAANGVGWNTFTNLTVEEFGAGTSIALTFNDTNDNTIRGLVATSSGGTMTTISSNGFGSGQFVEHLNAAGSPPERWRIWNNRAIYFRNAADNADVHGLSLNTSDTLVVGQSDKQTTIDSALVVTGTSFITPLEGSASNVPHWILKVVDFGDMTAGATADTFALWTLPANTMIHDVVGTVVTGWSGGSISAAVASVGTNGGAANDLTLDDDFFSTGTRYELHDATASGGKGALLFDATDKFAPYMAVAAATVELQMDLTGDNHANATAGQARIYALVSLPLQNISSEAN
jgi:hypothetical protein